MKNRVIILFFLITIANQLAAQKLPVVIPEQVGLNTVHLLHLDRVINEAIEKEEIPGAVVAIVKKDKIGYLKSFGYKQVYPTKEPMDITTIFDLASCTKPLATATAIMKLVEQGYIRLTDPVSDYLPDFNKYENDSVKKEIRIINLLTHTSGLPGYAPVAKLSEENEPTAKVLQQYIANCPRNEEPGKRMKYSCLNYITLQHIIETTTNQPFNVFCDDNIFKPLNLKSTGFILSDKNKKRCAPTELINDGELLCGTVHDPLARIFNKGVSGNAGLFSTAEEVALLTSLFLNNGIIQGKRILSPASIELMQNTPIGLETFGRTLGWDKNTAYSSNQGDMMSQSAFGHTGYTGTSITIDPEKELALIILTNSVHPYDKGKTNRLRSLIANIVVAADNAAGNQDYLKHYQSRIETFENETPITQKDIVFIGNSLTENGGDWGKRLGKKHIRNRGIIGDTTYGVINRLSKIVEGRPKQIIVTIGTNDISQGLNNRTIIENIDSIIKAFQDHSPQTNILIQNVLPINEKKSWYRLMKNKSTVISDLNVLIKQLASQRGVTFIESYNEFVSDNTNQLKDVFTNDGLHLNEEGYHVWSNFLKQYIK